jgi:SAM-dependent methyltransferase
LTAPGFAPPLERSDVRDLDEQAWLDRLVRSVDEPVQDGRRYPGFPDEGTQKAFVGSAYADALGEAFRFYSYIHRTLPLAKAKVASTRYLDFGCGWGRISRFFLRDFERGDMAGVDVDPGMIEFCQQAGAPGGYFSVPNGGGLPFADGSFRLVTAYSVFTHLPEPLFRMWMHELLRVTAPGGWVVFTVEPERFLDFVASIDRSAPDSGWHAALSDNLGELEARRQDLRRSGLTFLPTGGGPFREADVYGDTVVTPGFIDSAVQGYGRRIEYLDDPTQFWQAVAIVRRGRWTGPPRRNLSR